MAAALTIGTTALQAPTAVAATPQAVINRDFPDPSVYTTLLGHYAYSTNSVYDGVVRNIPVAESPSLYGPWSSAGDALPNPGAWVGRNPRSKSLAVWAPDVSRRADGQYLLYYAANNKRLNRHCVGAAVSPSPAGPFRPTGTPVVCTANSRDDIDPAAFVDGDGSRYLLYTSFPGRGGSTIWLQRMNAAGTGLVGGRVALLRANRPQERGIVEAPTLLRRGSRYVLFFSANSFFSGRYFVNYATSSRLAGGYTKAPGALVSKQTSGGTLSNPGGQTVAHSMLGGDRLVFHADVPGGRGMFVAGLSWRGDTPVVRF